MYNEIQNFTFLYSTDFFPTATQVINLLLETYCSLRAINRRPNVRHWQASAFTVGLRDVGYMHAAS